MEPAPTGTSRASVVVTVAGEMSSGLREEFDDLDIAVGHSVTRLRLPDGDPSMLHGVIRRVESLGLELLAVHHERSS